MTLEFNEQDDLDILENIEAAAIDDPKPNQDKPFKDVPDETIRHVDSMLIDMPAVESIAAKLPIIRAARESIEEGGISEAMAQQIAVDVPVILGPPEEPIAYSSRQTSAGADKAVAVLNTEEQAVTEKVTTATCEIIDKTLDTLEKDTRELNDGWVTLAEQTLATRSHFKNSTGEAPETAKSVFIGDVPLADVLYRSSVSSDDSQTFAEASSAFASLSESVAELTGKTISNFDRLFGSIPDNAHVAIAGYSYELSDLVEGEVEIESDCVSEKTRFNLLATLTSTQADPEEFEGSSSVFSATVKAANTLAAGLQELRASFEAQDCDPVDLVTKISARITLIEELMSAAKTALNVGAAFNTFLETLLTQAPAVVTPSTETIAKTAISVKRRNRVI